MMFYQKLITNTVPWPGVLDVSLLPKATVAAGHRLADAAKSSDWPVVMKLLDDEKVLVPHQWRPGGKAWFTPLHQAAWHGSPPAVADTLIKRGALKSLRDAKGRSAFDVAAEHDKPYDLRMLLKPPPSPLAPHQIHQINDHLNRVIEGRIGRLFGNRMPRQKLRYPSVEILHELPQWSVWFPIPKMHGGFHIELRYQYLEVISWNLEPGGTRQMHVITHDSAVLVSEEPA
jgi:hypothetical protein